MLTLSIVIEDRDEYGELKEFHKHEVTDPAVILHWGYHLIRHSLDCSAEMADAAKRLMDHHTSYEEIDRALKLLLAEKLAEQASEKSYRGMPSVPNRCKSWTG
jgi:hypothetical protein